MRDRDLYSQILGIQKPWCVTDVQLALTEGEVCVRVEATAEASFVCPECAKPCRRYDTKTRRWRHLPTCQYRTILEAEVPRIDCPEHGVKQVAVPWGERGSKFTALFEAVVIDWLKEASIAAVARELELSWDEVDGIMGRAVRRGLARRKREIPTRIGVDETSFQKRHEYVTVVSDLTNSRVLYVADDRNTESLGGFYRSLSVEERDAIEVVAMDMAPPFLKATREHLTDAERKIVFDKFHVAQHLSNAVNDVRKEESRELQAEGNRCLVGSKYLWLRREGVPMETRSELRRFSKGVLKTARAWAIKETAMLLWSYVRRGFAERAWKQWIAWALRCRLEPMQKVGRLVRDHLSGILNAVITRSTNARSESIAAKIQKLKARACGFRNRQRFRNAIYFHLGGLDLYPATAGSTHTTS